MTTLEQQLKEYKKDFLNKAPEEVAKLFSSKTEELLKTGIEEKTLKVGDTAPDFTLPGADGREVNLYQELETGPVVINFYRGVWCPYCNLELAAFSNLLPQIKELGGNLIAISPQTPDNSLTTKEKNLLEFSVLSDQSNLAAKKFGLVFSLADELRPVYKKFGISLPDANGDNTHELPLPATYVIGKDKIVKYAFAKADYTVRAEPSEVIDVLKEL